MTGRKQRAVEAIRDLTVLAEAEPEQIVDAALLALLPSTRIESLFALNEMLGLVLGLTKVDELTAVEAINTLDALRDVVETIGKLDALLCRHVYLHGEHGTLEVEGVGAVKVYRSRASERWQGREAAFAAVDVKMTEAGDGELPDPMTVVEWVLDVAAIGYCRKGALRELGLDPELFYESVPGKPKVDLPRRD